MTAWLVIVYAYQAWLVPQPRHTRFGHWPVHTRHHVDSPAPNPSRAPWRMLSCFDPSYRFVPIQTPAWTAHRFSSSTGRKTFAVHQVMVLDWRIVYAMLVRR
jgi:hypothetical protein